MRSLLLALTIALSNGTLGFAIQIEVEYTGSISAVPGTLINTFSVGDTFFGSYVFESTTPADSGPLPGFAGYNAVLVGEIELDTQLQNLIELDFAPTNPDPHGQGIQVDDASIFQGNPAEDRYGYVNRVTEGLAPLHLPASGAGGSSTADLLSLGFALFGGGDVNIFTDASLPTELDLSDFQRSTFLMLFEVLNMDASAPPIFEGVLGGIDSITFLPVDLPGDMNGDRAINFGDLSPFALGLSDPPGYEAAYPDVDRVAAGDINGDGFFNFADLSPFVELLNGRAASGSAVPEPSTLQLLATLAGLTGARRSRRAK